MNQITKKEIKLYMNTRYHDSEQLYINAYHILISWQKYIMIILNEMN